MVPTNRPYPQTQEKAQVMAGLMEGKISLVTGASSDIGRATALVMAREGATVVVSDIDADGAEEVLDSVKKIGADGIAVPSDVSDGESARALIVRVVETYGRLDCACNHSGSTVYTDERLHECPEEVWDQLFDVDLRSIWLGLKCEIAQMLRQGSGSVVNIAVSVGPTGSPHMSVCAAKANAVVGLTRSAALEYAAKGIRVNAVCPGTGGMPEVQGLAAEIAEAVTWLCSDAASLITGLALNFDGRQARS